MSEWECVNETTHRLSVPGGWLYKTWSESLVGDYYGLKTVVPGTVCVTFVQAPPMGVLVEPAPPDPAQEAR